MTLINENMLPDGELYRYWKILLPDVARTEERLRTGKMSVPMAEEGWQQLDLLLLKRLNQIAFRPLQRLEEQIAAETNALAAYGLQLISREQREDSLEKLLRQAAEPDFFAQKLPRCRGYLDIALKNYEQYIGTLWNRVAEKKAEIETRLLGGRRFTRITKIVSDAGDLHNHGQATALITTDGGTFVYKPHDPGIDRMMEELAEGWFRDTLRVPRVISGEGYGFHEYIVNRPAATEAEAEAFYTHLGGQCAIYRMLGSYDLHLENFLAEGGMPVPIDMETMLMPQPRAAASSRNNQPAFLQDINRSLIGSAILPLNPNGHEFSILMNDTEQNVSCPCIEGHRTTVLDYEEAFFRGLTEVYRRCMEHREKLADFLRNTPEVSIRKLLHSTNAYMTLLEKLHTYREKSSRDDHELLMQILCGPDASDGIPDYGPVAACEAESLREGDVPYFHTMSRSTDLMYEGKTVYPGFMGESGIDHALSRLEHMSERELDFELRICRESLEKQIREAELPENCHRNLQRGAVHTNRLKEAENIFTLLEADAIHSPGGGTDWMEPDSRLGSIRPLDMGLGTGISGILIFLAALTGTSENPEIRARARSLCEEILSLHAYSVDRMEKGESTVPTDFMEGMAGVLLALCYADRWLASKECDRMIRQILRLLRTHPEDQRKRSDYLTGIGGLVHVLCRIPRLRDESLIRRFADEILAQRTLDSKLSFKLWDTIGKPRPISGMGHGQAGIGVALWNAGQVLEEEKYRQAALDCFRWEHQIYDESLKTWPDLREITARPRAMHGFCSGAPGIGIALLSCEGLGETLETYGQDLERALASVSREAPQYRDHLCCGNMASVEFLLEYGRRTGSREALDQAEDRMTECLQRKAATGTFSLIAPDHQPFFLSDLFYGVSGIGYTLLRMWDPTIPSVLIPE